MRPIRWAVVLATFAGAAGLTGCSKDSYGANTPPVEPTAAEAQARKEWQAAVDDEEKDQERQGLRANPKDAQQLLVDREEREHRAELGEGPKPKSNPAKKK